MQKLRKLWSFDPLGACVIDCKAQVSSNQVPWTMTLRVFENASFKNSNSSRHYRDVFMYGISLHGTHHVFKNLLHFETDLCMQTVRDIWHTEIFWYIIIERKVDVQGTVEFFYCIFVMKKDEDTGPWFLQFFRDFPNWSIRNIFTRRQVERGKPQRVMKSRRPFGKSPPFPSCIQPGFHRLTSVTCVMTLYYTNQNTKSSFSWFRMFWVVCCPRNGITLYRGVLYLAWIRKIQRSVTVCYSVL